MPKTVEVKLYQFEELSDKAKEKAREWWRECEAQEFGQDSEWFYESYVTAAKLLGIEIDTHPVKLMRGGTRYDPKIWWMLHNQGAGASFEGSYSYAKDAAKKIAKEFSEEHSAVKLAERLQALQKKYRYRITARITTDSRDVHKYSMGLETDFFSGDAGKDDYKELLDIMRDFADYIYRSIQDEYEYRMSDENVDESIRINEYWFRENGQRSDG
jgi:hypothetical protein